MYDYNIKNYYIVTEYFDKDSSFLFDNIFYKQKIYDTYMIQFLMGLFFLERKGYRHGDFKPNNILCKNTESNIIFHYKIETIDFFVPTYGYLYAIIDFGNLYPLKIKKDDNDIMHYVDNIIRTIRYSNVKKYLQIYKTIDEFLNLFDKEKQREIINNSTFKNDLSSYISYALKKNYIESNNDLLNKYVYKLKNILNEKLSLIDILKNNFGKYKIYKKKYDKYKIIHFNISI